MIDAPRLVEVAAAAAAVIHLQIPRSAIQQEMEPAINEIMGVLAAQGTAPAGPLFAHHLSRSDTRFDFEVGFQTAAPVRAEGRVRAGSLPAMQAAMTVWRGRYEELYAAWQAFEEQVGSLLAAQRLRMGASFLEIYKIGPETVADPARYETELYMQVVAG